MDRSDWLKLQRQRSEEQGDRIYSATYDEHWGAIPPTHQRLYEKFLRLTPPGGQILDAACGTGRVWPLIIASGRTVFGIDQSAGMLAQAAKKFPEAKFEKVGLQELTYDSAFYGASCMDALEGFPPEDWPLVLANIHRALKPDGYFYFTVELPESEEELAKVNAEARAAGHPVVNREYYLEGNQADWAQEGAYHYYPEIAQVRTWLSQAGFEIIEEMAGEDSEYFHFIVRK
jgi:SAM-dependent methyltransferase